MKKFMFLLAVPFLFASCGDTTPALTGPAMSLVNGQTGSAIMTYYVNGSGKYLAFPVTSANGNGKVNVHLKAGDKVCVQDAYNTHVSFTVPQAASASTIYVITTTNPTLKVEGGDGNHRFDGGPC